MVEFSGALQSQTQTQTQTPASVSEKLPLITIRLSGGYLGGCQNVGPFLAILNIRCRILIGTQGGTIILTTTHLLINRCFTRLLLACLPMSCAQNATSRNRNFQGREPEYRPQAFSHAKQNLNPKPLNPKP